MKTWLGIDAGGTRTRWALVDGNGATLAEGEGAGMTAMHVGRDDGRSLSAALSALTLAIRASGAPRGACVAMTGLGDHADIVRRISAQALGLATEGVRVITDIEAVCRDLFSPGAGYVVYAGTGSVAAFLDAGEVLHRAGGRGVGLDDGGGGYWLAREALRAIWRREDGAPGAWRQSALAQAVFDRLGDSSWARSRDFFYGATRGEIGQLALAVAAAAERDEEARNILRAAGEELARLGRAMLSRFGTRPVALAGRAAALHPLILQAAQASLPAAAEVTWREARAHHAAARLAVAGGGSDNHTQRTRP